VNGSQALRNERQDCTPHQTRCVKRLGWELWPGRAHAQVRRYEVKPGEQIAICAPALAVSAQLLRNRLQTAGVIPIIP
jgi:hypothetical protein